MTADLKFASDAVPIIDAGPLTNAPSCGSAIATVGGVLSTTIGTRTSVVAPALSEATSERVTGPSGSVWTSHVASRLVDGGTFPFAMVVHESGSKPAPNRSVH